MFRKLKVDNQSNFKNNNVRMTGNLPVVYSNINIKAFNKYGVARALSSLIGSTLSLLSNAFRKIF